MNVVTWPVLRSDRAASVRAVSGDRGQVSILAARAVVSEPAASRSPGGLLQRQSLTSQPRLRTKSAFQQHFRVIPMQSTLSPLYIFPGIFHPGFFRKIKMRTKFTAGCKPRPQLNGRVTPSQRLASLSTSAVTSAVMQSARHQFNWQDPSSSI